MRSRAGCADVQAREASTPCSEQRMAGERRARRAASSAWPDEEPRSVCGCAVGGARGARAMQRAALGLRRRREERGLDEEPRSEQRVRGRVEGGTRPCCLMEKKEERGRAAGDARLLQGRTTERRALRVSIAEQERARRKVAGGATWNLPGGSFAGVPAAVNGERGDGRQGGDATRRTATHSERRGGCGEGKGTRRTSIVMACAHGAEETRRQTKRAGMRQGAR